jgi:hypothetical protein
VPHTSHAAAAPGDAAVIVGRRARTLAIADSSNSSPASPTSGTRYGSAVATAAS